MEIVEKRQVEMIEISNRMSRILKSVLGKNWLAQFSSAIQKNYQLVFKTPDAYEDNGKFFLFQLKSQMDQVPSKNAANVLNEEQ